MVKNQDLLQIGRVIGVHGIEGELKIKPYTQNPEDFKSFETIIVKGKELKIRQCRVYKGKVFLFLERVTKRITAEKLLKEKLFIRRDQTSELQKDEFFIIDLIGATVFDRISGESIGQLVDVKQTGTVDNFEIDLGENSILVPALKEYFEIIDVNRITAQIPKEYFEL